MCAEQRGRTSLRSVSNGWGSGGPPTEIFPKLDSKCCNQSYSWALFVNKGGPGIHPWKFSKKNRLEMVQSELFWSLFVIFFFESGATPVYPEQLAAMYGSVVA